MSASHWSLLLGALLTIKGGVTLAAQPAATRLARGFSRNVWTGRLLAAIAWGWAGWALYSMPLELLLPIRAWILPLTLVAIPLAWFWMADLLSCRSVGGLLVLFPYPLLQATRSHPSEWRLALAIFAYACIVTGMILILYPYYLRRWIDWVTARTGRMRIAGVLVMALGLFFIGIGVTALR